MRSMKEDRSLDSWRKMADKKEGDLVWEKGLLIKKKTDDVGREIRLIVVPKSYRERLLALAHDRIGHLGSRKTGQILTRQFIWPGCGADVARYCRSCQVCQKANKTGSRKAPMVARPALTQPFESVAFDLVGPLPKGKGGDRFILTNICLAKKWPEAVPVRNVSSGTMGQAMVDILCRTAIPCQLLTDQGSQFLGGLVRQLCKVLGVEQVNTTAYHPQTNGVLERLHGTLESILTNTKDQGFDWVNHLPLAMAALRRMPNRDAGFSPAELMFGENTRGPLEIVYEGWRKERKECIGVCSWVEKLCDKLESLRAAARVKQEVAIAKRKESYDRGKCLRSFDVGTLLLLRVPGFDLKLQDAWKGPYKIIERLGEVNYRVDDLKKGHKSKVVHINNIKEYVERTELVGRISIMLEQEDAGLSQVVVDGIRAEEFCQEELEGVLKKV